MGTVFQAYDRVTRQIVAVKVLHGKGETDAARFVREAELLSELRHPAIVRFIDHGTTPHGEPYYSMEWLEGETLDERLRRGPLAPSLVARLGGRVLEALGVAHGRGVIHRDIKPSNIYLVGFRINEAKLIDFGVARRTDDAFRLTKRGNTVGTPMYNAPEQARGLGDLDGRVDIFALGCVLYEALAGEPAFAGDTPGQVMSMIATGQGPDVHRRLAAVDSELRTVIDAMLAHRRDERPADAKGLGARLVGISERLAPLEAPQPLHIKPSAMPRPLSKDVLSHNEQRVMAVLVLAKFPNAKPQGGGHAKGSPEALSDELLGQLGAALEALGGRIDRLLDRSVIVTAPALNCISEQAEQMGRMGLVIVAKDPTLSVAMATGRGVLLARLPAGEVIEQAAVLLEHARPGVVTMDDTSARLLSARFSMLHERAQHVLLKEREGAAQPRRILGDVTPFSGRERELATLFSVLGTAAEDDAPRAAVITSAAGGGKSRLLHELFRRLSGRAEDLGVVRARAIPLSSTLPYCALSGMFEIARIPAAVRATDAVANVFMAWLEKQCARQQVVLVLEDAHLADTSSLQLLDSFLGHFSTLPLVVIVTGRPELLDRFPDLFETHSPTRIRVPLFARRHAETALRGVLPASRPDIDEWIFARCRGNPFYVEELARHAVLPGRLPLPDTVAGLIQAEVDNAGSEGKRVLRAASVYGTSFDAPGVAALLGREAEPLMDDLLQGLLEQGFLAYDNGNETTPWRFVELVVREAVYEMLPAGDRALARRLARGYLERVGRDVPPLLQPGDSRVNVTPSHSPALAFLTRT